MDEIKLGVVEGKFADIIWENEPMTTKELVDICVKELDWKRTTTYTVLKKLSEKGIFKTEDSIVTAVISRDEFYAIQSENFVDSKFKGSLPAFIATFIKRKNITKKELDEIKRLLDSYGEE